MSREGSEWNDKDILAGTKQIFNDAGTHKKFSIVLPGDDKPLTSEFMDPTKIKASVLIHWCEAVRATVGARQTADAEEKAAKRARRKSAEAAGQQNLTSVPTATAPLSIPAPVESKPASTAIAPQVVSSRVPSADPREYAQDQLDYATERLVALRGEAEAILIEIKKLDASRSQWSVILDNFGDTA